MVISGTDVTRLGQREDALINSTDLFATIADLAGTGLESIHDSRSFKNLLNGGQMEERKFVYSEVEQNTTAWTIRNQEHKLIDFQNGTQEFYDLDTDPYEQNDLILSGPTSEDLQAKTELENLADGIRNKN
jgi:arylsulfatase A-like enzyme